MIVAIHQPNYLPWCGYFAKIMACDTFVFLDDVQLSKGSFVPRTRVRAGDGERWYTVPVARSAFQSIAAATISDPAWGMKHVRALEQEYRKAPAFGEVMSFLKPLLLGERTGLAESNIALIQEICRFLGLDRRFVLSSSLDVAGAGDDRLIGIVRALGGTEYLSGAGGQNYQDPAKFAAEGQVLTVRSYQPRPYEAPAFPFRPGLSIIDALFILGRDARDLLTYEQKTEQANSGT